MWTCDVRSSEDGTAHSIMCLVLEKIFENHRWCLLQTALIYMYVSVDLNVYVLNTLLVHCDWLVMLASLCKKYRGSKNYHAFLLYSANIRFAATERYTKFLHVFNPSRVMKTGPIAETRPHHTCTCTWFNYHKKLQQTYFNIRKLTD